MPTFNYTFDELYGAGTSSIDLTAGTNYTFNITNNSGSSYFAMETNVNQNGVYGDSSPKNLSGSFTSITNIATAITSSNYISGFALPQGTNSFIFTPTFNVTGSTLKLRGTGGITLGVTQLISTPTPILFYNPANINSYSGTGVVVTNLTGSAPNGALEGSVTFTNPYFTYNGTSSTIKINDSAVLEPDRGDFTVELWVRPTVFSGQKILIAKTDSGLASGWGYGLRLSPGSTAYFEVGNGTNSVVSPSSTLTANVWQQVVGVWSNVDSKFIKMYVNGVSPGQVSHSVTSVKDTTSPLYIGSFNGGQFSQWFTGDTGITRIYNAALTADQISQLFNNDKAIYGL
jgi:hypothetical protein